MNPSEFDNQKFMSKYHATVVWERKSQKFTDNKYSRAHYWKFSEATIIAASSSPHIVPLPYSTAENIDPEEAFVASLSSCHMLFIAAKMKWVVDTYEDQATGILEKNVDGKLAMTSVMLNPTINYSGPIPTKQQQQKIHHLAHEECFIANSVKTQVEIKQSST